MGRPFVEIASKVVVARVPDVGQATTYVVWLVCFGVNKLTSTNHRLNA
jgi:hypothetical protein